MQQVRSHMVAREQARHTSAAKAEAGKAQILSEIFTLR